MKTDIISKTGEMISLDEDVLRTLISTSQIFISLIKRFYPEAYQGILQAFDDVSNMNPDFEADRDCFISVMCPLEIDQKDEKRAAAARNFVRGNKGKDETHNSENHQHFEISR